GGIELVDPLLQPLHLRLGHGQARTAWSLLRQTEIGLDVEQVVLDACQHGIERAIVGAVQARDADHRIDLVERAVSVDPQVVFLATLAGAERGGAIVAGARVDPVENDHRRSPVSNSVLPGPCPRYRPSAQMVIIMTTMATNCSSTRSRISFC